MVTHHEHTEVSAEEAAVLGNKLTRRKAIGTMGKVAAGAVVAAVVAGSAGYYAGTLGGAVQTTTVTETATAAATTAAATTAPPVTLSTLAFAGPRFEQVYVALRDGFKQQYPNINIDIEAAPGTDVMFVRGPTELSTHSSAYDLLNVEEGMKIGLADNLLDMYPYINDPDPKVGIPDLETAYGPALVNSGKWKGRFVWLSSDCNTHIQYYREDVLKDAGFDKPAETWDEAEEIVKAVHKPPTRYGWIQMAQPWYSGGDWTSMNRYLGGIEFDSGWHPTVDTEVGLRALEYLKMLYKYGVPGIENFYDPDINEQLGSTGLGVFAPDEYGNGAAQNPTISRYGDLIKTVRVPKGVSSSLSNQDGPANYDGRAARMGGVPLTVNNWSKHPKEAYLFVRYLQAPENGRAYCAASGQPGRTATLRDPVNQAQDNNHCFAALADSFAFDTYHKAKLSELPQIDTILGEEMHLALFGGKASEAALASAESRLDEVMKKAGYY